MSYLKLNVKGTDVITYKYTVRLLLACVLTHSEQRLTRKLVRQVTRRLHHAVPCRTLHVDRVTVTGMCGIRVG